MRYSLLAITLIAISSTVNAEVTQSSNAGFIIAHDSSTQHNAKTVFEVMTREVNQWWNPDHSFSGDSDHLSITKQCFCERWQNNYVEHLKTSLWIDNKQVIFEGGLGPLKELGLDGTMIWSISSENKNMTTINWKYYVNGYSDTDMKTLAVAVDGVILEQLTRLSQHLKEHIQ